MEDKGLICPVCKTEFKEDAHLACPKCKNESGAFNLLISVREYNQQKRTEELSRHLYCRDCDHKGLIEDFPFDAPPDEDFRERRCPNCTSDNLVNLGSVKMCERCDEVPAEKDDYWCQRCRELFEFADPRPYVK